MNLYKLFAREGTCFYVVHEDPTSAQEALNEAFAKTSRGPDSDREIITIELISKEVEEFPAGKPNFNGMRNLLIKSHNRGPIKIDQ